MSDKIYHSYVCRLRNEYTARAAVGETILQPSASRFFNNRDTRVHPCVFSYKKLQIIVQTFCKYPIHTCENFHNIIKQKLNDQFIQEWKSNVLSWNRCTVLSTLFNRYEMSTYLTVVKDLDVRNIYTRLRINIYALSTSYSCNDIKDMCPLCDTEHETVSYFIL